MPVQFTSNVTCDGCGRPIAVEAEILPVILADESRNAIYFCSHLCIHPYADRRHGERVEAITLHLEGNVEQIRANLADAREREDESDVATIEPFLAEAEAELAEWTKVHP